MRLESIFAVSAVVFILAVPGWAASDSVPAETPRQALQKVEALFAQGHEFDEKELAALEDLKGQLVDSGDKDLAADLALLQLAVTTRAQAADRAAKASANLPDDVDQWNAQASLEKNKGSWKSVRDIGLLCFSISTVTTLLLAAVNDRNDALEQNGYYSDWNFREQFSNGMHWALLVSASGMLASLYPLLWGEARQ